MAPLWSSTWSYSLLPGSNGRRGDATGSAMTSDYDHGRDGFGSSPNVAQLFSSRPARLVLGVTLAVICALMLSTFFGPHDVAYWKLRLADAALGFNRPSTDPTSHNIKCDTVDWSRFAYTQYVTNKDYLCNSVMIFESLHRLGSQADRVMMYPKDMMEDPSMIMGTNRESKLLIKARDQYHVKLSPITVQRKSGGDSTWAESYTKLLAFNQTQYDRILNVDSDSTILQTMDELFLMPPAPVAMPRAYWLLPEQHVLSSQLMLIQPSAQEFGRVLKELENTPMDQYDMEIVNSLYNDQAIVLPHRPYDLLTGEYRKTEHSSYIGNTDEAWNPVLIFNEAKYLHFSDWPVPKPWIAGSEGTRKDRQPECAKLPDGQEDCSARDLWNGFYEDFANRLTKVCDT